MKKTFKLIAAILLIVIITMTVSVAGTLFFVRKTDRSFTRLRHLETIIKNVYVGEYDAEKAEDAAIDSVIKSIDDKYAVYYDENETEETMNMLDGYYIGIGLEIFANTDKDKIEVISAYEDSPGYKAGIKSGDFILKIDGKEYAASNLNEAATYMRGHGIEKPLEKTIKMEIMRGEKKLTLEMKREKIDYYKVTSKLTKDGILYIRYSGFTENSEEKLEEIISKIDEDVLGIVIDIRDNPGGEFNSAIRLCDLFLDDGDIMYTEDKNKEKTVYKAKKGACDLPLAVLVNGSSASASEIFAGSMQARKRAVIVGSKTYGKGVSQTIQYINPVDASEGAVKLTTCKNFTPDGRWINNSIIPDINVETEPNFENIENDAAFKAASKHLFTID